MTTLGENGNGAGNGAAAMGLDRATVAGLEKDRERVRVFYAKADERRQGEDVPVGDDGTLWVRVFPVKAEDSEGFMDAVHQFIRIIVVEATDARSQTITPQGLIDALPKVIPLLLGGASGMVARACVAWESDRDLRSVADDKGKMDAQYREARGRDRVYGQPELEKLAISEQGTCVAAWLRQSFMGDRVRPLLRMVETVLSTTMKKPVKIEELWSIACARAATTLTKSTAGTERDDATAGRTTAGVSPNSAGAPTPS